MQWKDLILVSMGELRSAFDATRLAYRLQIDHRRVYRNIWSALIRGCHSSLYLMQNVYTVRSFAWSRFTIMNYVGHEVISCLWMLSSYFSGKQFTKVYTPEESNCAH